MAIIKESTFPAMGADGEPLVRLLDDLPSGGLEKTAGIHPEILSYKQQLEPEPGKTYVHILALGAGDYYGANLNNDHFAWQGLQHDHTKTPHPYLHGYKTFLNAHAFAHHVNKDPEKAYGDVLISVLNNKMRRVELIVGIDDEKCSRNGGQRTLDKIKDGQYPSTSMGCRVPFDVCSICGHRAKYRREYCDHMRTDAGKIMADGRKVFVYNPFPRFFDISFVFIGADRTSFVLEKVANYGADQEKVAIIDAVKGLNWTTKGLGSRVAGGMLAGGVTGAVAGKDGNRDVSAVKGALTGGVLAGTGGQLLKSGIGGTATAGILGATTVAGGGKQEQPLQPPPPHTSNLQKFAAKDGGMGRALRRSSGTVKPFAGMRVKKKVARQSKLKIRPLTFGKLRTSAKQSKLDTLNALALSPLPQLTLNEGATLMHNPLDDQWKVAALKNATVTKLSDIFKDVNASPMGRAVEMSVGPEPDIGCAHLDRIAKEPDLGGALSGMASAGVVLKPREFQRVVLVRSGLGDMARGLDSHNTAFPESAPMQRSIRIVIKPHAQGAIPSGVLDLVKNVLSSRSALSPMMLRRDTAYRPAVTVKRIALGVNPVLDKVAALYNGYREDLLMNAEAMIKVGMATPELVRSINTHRGVDGREGPAFEAMMQVPLAYFSHAYWNRSCCSRGLSDLEFAKHFTEENPDIAKYISQHIASEHDCASMKANGYR
jgi:hypothetical protein